MYEVLEHTDDHGRPDRYLVIEQHAKHATIVLTARHAGPRIRQFAYELAEELERGTAVEEAIWSVLGPHFTAGWSGNSLHVRPHIE